MIYLLDTNTCIQYLTGRNSLVVEKLKAHKPSDIVLCDVVKSELYYGAYIVVSNKNETFFFGVKVFHRKKRLSHSKLK